MALETRLFERLLHTDAVAGLVCSVLAGVATSCIVFEGTMKEGAGAVTELHIGG